MNQGARKVPLDMAVILTGVAFIFDLINILIEYLTFGIGGFIMDFVSAITFTLWLGHYDIRLWGNRNIGWSMATALIDMLPFGDLTFPWTIRVASLAFTERKEIPVETKKRSVSSGWRL